MDNQMINRNSSTANIKRHMWELQKEDALFTELQTHVYHATSLDNYRLIIKDGFLRPNLGQFPNSTGQSAISRARKLEAISFFDFVSPSLPNIFDELSHHYWTAMLETLASRGCAILIGFSLSDLTDKWISHVKARQLFPDFNIMLLSVEACYKGVIPLQNVRKQIVYDRLDIGQFHIFDGRLLEEQEIASLEEQHKSSQPSDMPEWFAAHVAKRPNSSGSDKA